MLVFGKFRLLAADDRAIFAYVKEGEVDGGNGTRKAAVVLNFSNQEQDHPDLRGALGVEELQTVTMVLSTTDKAGTKAKMGRDVETKLQPWEGRLYANFTV